MQAPLTQRAIEYGWRELTRRAGFAEDDGKGPERRAPGLSFHYGQPEDLRGERPAVVVVPCEPADWRRLLELPDGRLETMPVEGALPPGAAALPIDPLPILFRGRGSNAGGVFATRIGRTVVFECDLIASALFLLCRWEETVVSVRDEHGRMPFTESVSYRQGFLERPLIDEYGLLLREWLKQLLPGWVPAAGRFAVKLSHDVDVVRPFSTMRSAAKLIAGDLVRRRNPARALSTARLAALQRVAPRRMTYYEDIFRLAEISRRHGMASAFYFMAARAGPYDSGYDPGSRPIREAIRKLEDLGFEIGFHPGYDTFANPARLAEEKSRLDAVLGRSRYGGRQHYLRFRVPETWRDWERMGLAYDSTMTYAGHEGFRCGTCHSYYPFDIEADRVLDIQELPLVVMDGTLRQYRGLAPLEGEGRILELARRCRDVEGTFTLLWHNSSLSGEWASWGSNYETLVRKLSELEGRSTSESHSEADSPEEDSINTGAASRWSPKGAQSGRMR